MGAVGRYRPPGKPQKVESYDCIGMAATARYVKSSKFSNGFYETLEWS